jgi:O-antigen/teichoic acid export membrane protein
MWLREQADHLVRRLPTVGLTLAYQGGLQGLALATGLLIIHAITKEAYGLYAIVVSIQGMASVLSDAGIGSAVTAVLGKTWNDRNASLNVVATALRERQRLLVWVLPLSAITMAVIVGNKTSVANLVIMEVALLASIYFEVSAFLYQLVPLYGGKRNQLQALQMTLSGARIVAVLVLALVFHINLIALLAINVVFYIAGFIFTRRLAIGTEPVHTIIDTELQQHIHRNILRFLPSSAFYAFQGQITTYIISLSGQLADVASVAALGRIGLLFTLLLNIISMLGCPAFSKATSRKEGLRIFWAVTALVALFALLLFGASLLFPHLILEIIGRKYEGLTVELQITVISSGLSAIATAIWGLLAARGLIGLSWTYIFVTLATQITYGFLGDLHTVRGVLWFGVVTVGTQLLVVLIVAYFLVLRPKELGRNS